MCEKDLSWRFCNSVCRWKNVFGDVSLLPGSTLDGRVGLVGFKVKLFSSRSSKIVRLLGSACMKSSSLLSSELIAEIRSMLASLAIEFLNWANFSRSCGSVGVKALRPWMFSFSGKVSRTRITLDPSELTSTLGLGRAFAFSPPPGLRMMFINMFRLTNGSSAPALSPPRASCCRCCFPRRLPRFLDWARRCR